MSHRIRTAISEGARNPRRRPESNRNLDKLKTFEERCAARREEMLADRRKGEKLKYLARSIAKSNESKLLAKQQRGAGRADYTEISDSDAPYLDTKDRENSEGFGVDGTDYRGWFPWILERAAELVDQAHREALDIDDTARYSVALRMAASKLDRDRSTPRETPRARSRGKEETQ